MAGLSEPAAEARRMLTTFPTYWWLWAPTEITLATLDLRQYTSRHYALCHEARAEKSRPGIFSHLADLTNASLSVPAQRASDVGHAMTILGGIPPFS